MSLFKNLPEIKYEAKITQSLHSYYDAERVIYGKKMKDHLVRHGLVAQPVRHGPDMFGPGTAGKSFGESGTSPCEGQGGCL